MKTMYELRELVSSSPEQIEFDAVMQMIDASYDFTPTAFNNGELRNEAGENNGSCKIFSLGQVMSFTEEETLACFGAYYRDEVLGDPDGSSHQNIRQFMLHGWDGVRFEGAALSAKAQ
jgi:hypothetical protein